jgi:hypothetical protein
MLMNGQDSRTPITINLLNRGVWNFKPTRAHYSLGPGNGTGRCERNLSHLSFFDVIFAPG